MWEGPNPARPVLLDGVVVNSGVSNPPNNNTVTLPDGTMDVTGYFSNALTNARDASISQFMVQSSAVWERYSQYAVTSANSFFPAYAAANTDGQSPVTFPPMLIQAEEHPGGHNDDRRDQNPEYRSLPQRLGR